jgi:hypothetical protein
MNHFEVYIPCAMQKEREKRIDRKNQRIYFICSYNSIEVDKGK